jgi:hypothetical protein
VITARESPWLITYKFVAIGNVVKNDLVRAGIAPDSKFEVIYPGLQELR